MDNSFSSYMREGLHETKRMYQKSEHVNTFETEATIVEVETIGGKPTVVLDKTIFHPKGGGQPSDRGSIVVPCAMVDGRPFDMIINDARSVVEHIDNGRIYHFVDYPEHMGTVIKTEAKDVELVGQSAIVKIDPKRRIINRRYHSAGHIIAQAVRELTNEKLREVIGNHTPGESFVEFAGRLPAGTDVQQFAKRIQEKVARMVSQAIQPSTSSTIVNFTSEGTKMRKVAIGGNAVFCGGTHVEDTSEIGNVAIGHIRNKKRDLSGYEWSVPDVPTTRISYTIS